MDDDNLKNCTSQLLPELGSLNSSEMLDALSTMLNSHRDRATLKIMLHDCLYPNNSHPYFLPWWQKTIWTSLFGAMLLVSTTGNTTVIWIVLGNKMTTCKRSDSSESDLQDYVINGCSSAISLKRELSCYAMNTINDWGDSVARQLLTSNNCLMTELQQFDNISKVKQNPNPGKKTSWKNNMELASSLDEIDDSFTNCISAIASRIAFARDDDEELFEYRNERSITSLQSEPVRFSDVSFQTPFNLNDCDNGVVEGVQNLTLATNTLNIPKSDDKHLPPNYSFHNN